MTEHVKQHSQIPGALMQAQLGAKLNLEVFLEEKSGVKKKIGKPLEKQSINRRRALLLSNKEVMANYLSEEGKRKGMSPLAQHSRYYSADGAAAAIAGPAPLPPSPPGPQAPLASAPGGTAASSSISSSTHSSSSSSSFSPPSSRTLDGAKTEKSPPLPAAPAPVAVVPPSGPTPMDVDSTRSPRIPTSPQKRALPATDIPDKAAKRAREDVRRSALALCTMQFNSLK